MLQNWKRHGAVVFGSGVVDPFSSGARFSGWSDSPEPLLPDEPWPNAAPRTWLLRIGWSEHDGPLHMTDAPAATANLAPIVHAYLNRDPLEPSHTPP